VPGLFVVEDYKRNVKMDPSFRWEDGFWTTDARIALESSPPRLSKDERLVKLGPILMLL